MEFVAALLGIFQKHRQLGEVDEPLLHIVLGSDGAQVHDLGIFRQRHLHPVEVRKLIALRIHLIKIRIPLQHPRRRIDRLRHPPRRECRQRGVQPPIGFEAVILHPVRIPGRLGRFGDLLDGTISRQELLQIMRRCIAAKYQTFRLLPRLPATHRAVTTKQLREQKMRVLEFKGHRGFVDFHQTAGFAVGHELRRGGGRQFLVAVDVLKPEQKVVGGERRAIGPFHALAQEQRGPPPIGRKLETLGHLRHQLRARHIPEQQLVARADAVAILPIARPEERPPPGAAINPGLAQRFQHKQIRR